MKLADRAVDWTTMSAHEAARVVRFSDSSPGCPHTLRGIKYRLFGAFPEGGGGCGGCGGCGGGGKRCGSATDEVLSRAGAEPGDPVGETNVVTHRYLPFDYDITRLILVLKRRRGIWADCLWRSQSVHLISSPKQNTYTPQAFYSTLRAIETMSFR